MTITTTDKTRRDTAERMAVADPLTPRGGMRDAAMWAKRVSWLVLIWVGSVAALGGAAYLMRMLMRAIGMSN